MKSLRQSRKSHAFTLVEMLVVIAIIAILGAMLLPALTRGKQRAQRIQCIGNQKQLGIAFQIFAHDHQGKFPMQVSQNDGGAEEYVVAGETLGGSAFTFSWRLFQPLANELVVPKILVCPADVGREPATTFGVLQNSNISYAIGVDANYNDPSSVVATDRNITNTLGQSLAAVRANENLAWTRELHFLKGNVLFADAHVEELNTVKASLPNGTVLFLPYVRPIYTTHPAPPVTISQGQSPAGITGFSPASTVAHAPRADDPTPPPASLTPLRSNVRGSGTTASQETPDQTTSQTIAKETNGVPVTQDTEPVAAPATTDNEPEPPLLWLLGAARTLVAKVSWWLLLLIMILVATAVYFYSRRKMNERRRKP